MKTPRDKALLYTVFVIAATIVIFAVIGFVAGLVMP